ncbi:MAG: 6-phosphofructokinase [Erysipelotrichaceae bacterium]|nr:6-phosphofructokinase [Erysipelotrichaceae bacterium]
MIKKIGVLTSGGDSPGMNAAIRAVTRTALTNGIEVVGIRDGYKGLVEGWYEPFKRSSVSETISTGGTILGSARLPEFKEEAVLMKGVEKLKENNVDALVVIGGDGTYKGAAALTKKGINCISLPGTIDNDIEGTDFTIGFDTALNTIVECVDKLRDTSNSHHRCSVVEVMGNRCGDLAIYSGISCGAEVLITPETGYDEEAVLEKLKYLEKRGKSHAIVIVSEKVCDVQDLADKVSKMTGFSGRATILGHIQRGGSPTPYDRVLASRMGAKAVELLIEGRGGECVCIKNNEITSMPIEECISLPRSNRKEFYKLFDQLV